MIGERLKLARHSCGLSQDELAVEIGNLVTKQAIAKYEADAMMPSSAVLRALSRVLGVTERYLLNPGRIEITGIEILSKLDLGAKETGSIKAQVLSSLEKYLDIEELVPGVEAVWTFPNDFPYPIAREADAEHAATRLRAVWGLGRETIRNLGDFLEERGIKVFALELDRTVSGVLCVVQRGNNPPIPVIVINKHDQGERQRFALARYLGRWVLEISTGCETERVCDRFARAFLMIRDAIIAAVGKVRNSLPLGELLRLKRLFGASMVAIVQRCAELEIIDPTEKQRLCEKFSQFGWMKPPFSEPNRIPSENPTRFERLCMRALAEGAISESRAAELLSVSTWELGPLIDEPSRGYS